MPKLVKIGRLLYPEARKISEGRPKTRGECKDGLRPCPWVGCKYHLAIDVNPDTGAIHWNQPGEVWDMQHTCALDVAELGGITLEQTGHLLGVSRERARQIERSAVGKVAPREATELRDLLAEKKPEVDWWGQ